MAVILIGGFSYIFSLRESLTDQAIQTVLTVTTQQRQALDNFIDRDEEQLHSFAEYFSQRRSDDSENLLKRLSIFGEIDAYYSLINLDTGLYCNNKSEEFFQMEGAQLELYRSLTGSGTRDPYLGLYTNDIMFGYYERFTFADGVPGLIQKSYKSRNVSEAFSLSFYDNQGLAYVVNREGDILLRSVGMIGNRLYDNIFDVLTGTHGEQADIDRFMAALSEQEMGSMLFSGETGSFVYSYVPIETVADWFLVSVVPLDAITEETDQILMDSQMTFFILILVLIICGVLVMLIRRTHKDIKAKNQEIAYQEQLFDIFATYLANSTGDIYLMIDPDEKKVDYSSPNIERVLGATLPEVLSNLGALDRSVYISGEHAGQKVDFHVLKDIKPGEALDPINTEWVNPRTKEHKWFQASIFCTRVQERRKIVIYVSDRTQERTTQNALREALKIAQAANTAKSSFLSSVSHDIRTPMNAIIGFVALLQQDAEKPDLVMEYTRRIDAASQHLLGLINDVLDMNKIESGSATLNLSDVSLAEIINEINTIIRPQARAKNQTFEISVSSLTNEYLVVDKLRINQILINLLSNAVKYTEKDGAIEMRIEELPQVLDNYNRIRFTVKDNGLGMSEEYQKIIFDPFTREETKSTRNIQGTGLGMAITKSLVDLMGGTIEVQSKLGEGSTFTVELELRIQDRKDEPDFWARHRVARMIVADDDEEACLSVVRLMAGTGVITDYSTNGAAAVQMMRAAREGGHPYDLILLDWKMPNLDGLETARLIRQNYSKRIPILLLTAYDWEEIEDEAKEIGVNHFMPKPFFMSSFKDAIRRVMGNRAKKEGDKNNDVVRGKHILVVDDIEVNRILLVKILNTLGATCEVAANGKEALDAFEQSKPGEYDLILMDVQMPIMDGYMATRAIRASPHPSAKSVIVIAMTANAFVDDIQDALDSGMDAHIAKPVQLDKLKSTIQQALDQRNEQQKKEGEH